jgi:hypothetical protein
MRDNASAPGPFVTDEPLVYRRFSLGDGMIVVAALALFCALMRSWILILGLAIDRLKVVPGVPPVAGTPPPIDPLSFALVVWSGVPTSLVIGFLAFGVMRLRRPRPPFRVVALQPGMVALWAVAFHFGMQVLFFTTSGSGPTLWPTMVLSCIVLPVAWAALKLTKRWSPEPSWIDRLGRVLGICWWCAILIETWILAAIDAL